MLRLGDGQKPPPLWAVLSAFVLSRLVILLFVAPRSMVPYAGEELFNGTIGKLLLDHLGYPIWALRSDDYVWGSIVVGKLASVFFRLLGPTAFALKLAPLTFFTITLALWHKIISRHIGPRAAFAFSLLYVVSPPNFTAYSYTAMGFHSESTLFTALSAWLLLSILYDGRRSFARHAALGLSAGLGLWFCYHYLITLAAVVVFWAWHDRKRLPWKDFCVFAVFGIIGFTPWLLGNVWGPSRGWLIGGIPIWALLDFAWLRGRLGGIEDFVLYVLGTSFAFENWRTALRLAANVSYDVLFAAALGLAAAGLAKTAWRERLRQLLARPQPWTFAVVYLSIFLAAAQICTRKAWRYHIPAFPFLFCLTALALDFLRRRGRQAEASGILRGLLLTGVVCNALLLSPRHAGEIFSTKGYVYSYLPPGVCVAPRPCLAFYRKLAPLASREERFQLASAAADTVMDELSPTMPHAVLLRRIDELSKGQPPLLRHHLHRAFGAQTNSFFPSGQARPSFFLRPPLAPRESEDLRFYTIGFMTTMSALVDGNWPAYRTMAARSSEVPPWAQPVYWRFLGRRFASCRQVLDPSIDFLEKGVDAELRTRPWSERQRRWFIQGVGFFAKSIWKPGADDAVFDSVLLQRFPAARQRDLFLGAGMESILEEYIEDPFDQRRRLEGFTRGLTKANAETFEEGRRLAFELYEEPGRTEGPEEASAKIERGGAAVGAL